MENKETYQTALSASRDISVYSYFLRKVMLVCLWTSNSGPMDNG